MNRRPIVALVLALALLPAARPAAASLIASWSFDGCTTTDASGQALNLTANGSPACVPARFGSGWSLDGSTQYLDHAFDARFTPGARAWTVAAWEKSAPSSGFQAIVDWYRCGANPGCNSFDGADYILGVIDGHPYWDVRDDAISDLVATDTTRNVTDGAWHLLVGTVNPATDSLKLYVDGALRIVATGPIGNLTAGAIAIPLEIGRHFRTGWASPGYYFQGSLDEIRIFDEELSASAVAALFTNNAITAVGDERSPARLAIERCWPNPVRGGRALVGFDLPSDAPAALEVFDLAGRRVADVDGLQGAGRHHVELGAGRALEPGVYLVRLTQAGATATRRVTVLE